MRKKKFTVTIGIPAYNAESNIIRLLKALILQHTQAVTIDNIIVLSDASEDNTLIQAKSVKHPKLKVLNNTVRRGFAYNVKKILTTSITDIVIILNDDIVIKDDLLIEKLSFPLIKNVKVGLVGGNIEPFPAHNLVQKTAELGFLLLKRASKSMQSIHNNLTCDGKILALSKRFYKQITFPDDLSKMGNVDSYLYFLCLRNNFIYNFVPEAKVYFKLVNTLPDFINYSIRNRQSAVIIKHQFGQLAERETHPPKRFYEYLYPSELFKVFPYLVILFVLHYLVSIIEKTKKMYFTQIWNPVRSTKSLQDK